MWALIKTLLPIVLGWFGISASKSDAEIGLDKGEQLGKAETKAAQDDKIIKDVAAANAARDSVRDDSLREPDPFERK